MQIRRNLLVAVVGAVMAMPVMASAQGVPGGIERGSRDGERAAGPVGAVVGGWSAASSGASSGASTAFSEWTNARASVATWLSAIIRRTAITRMSRVGAVLPESGVTYYDVPQEYGVRDYRYTVVNDRTVLVDPRTRRIVEVVE
jgi:hypothetical protein